VFSPKSFAFIILRGSIKTMTSPGSSLYIRTAALVWLLLGAAGLGGAGNVQAATRAVPGQYPTIAGAIAAAVNGDEVVVAPGTYVESLNTAGKAIKLRSSGGAGVTRLSGLDLNARIITCNTGETAATIIEGFTFTQAIAPSGAAIFISNASPTVRDCVFYENFSEFFGGAVMSTGTASKPRLERCTFEFNSTYGTGGGLYLNTGAAVVASCLFKYNSGGGAGIGIAAGTHTVVNCKFLVNEGGFSHGGAIQIAGGTPVIANGVFAGNHSYFNGGAIWAGNASSPRVHHCTIVDNSATEGSGIHLADTTTAQFFNCLLWGNQNNAFGGTVTPVISFSNVQGGVMPGTGNLSSLPSFVDANGPDNTAASIEDNDYRVTLSSPGVDRGNSLTLPADLADLDGDGNIRETLPLDFDNHRRIVDSASAPNNGPDQPTDMGAYEARLPCRADISPMNDYQLGNDEVNVDDLLAVINNWGRASQQGVITLTAGALYEPSVLTVKAGDTVRWNFTLASHTVTSGANCTADGRFNQNTSAGGSFTYPVGNTFTGQIPYFCNIHCGAMVGTIIVKPFPGEVTNNALVNVDDILAVINAWGTCP